MAESSTPAVQVSVGTNKEKSSAEKVAKNVAPSSHGLRRAHTSRTADSDSNRVERVDQVNESIAESSSPPSFNISTSFQLLFETQGAEMSTQLKVNHRYVALVLYGFSYLFLSLSVVFGIKTFKDMAVADPYSTAVGIALAIVLGLWLTDKQVRRQYPEEKKP